VERRKAITAVLLALIIIVPTSVAVYWFVGPPRIEEVRIDTVSPDDADRLGVYIIGSATGGGKAYTGDVPLVIRDEGGEQVYSGRVHFEKNLLNERLPLDSFATTNGRYEFKLNLEGKTARYYYELDMLVERLGVYAANTTDTNQPGYAAHNCLWSYTITFMTGEHWWTESIEPDEFFTWHLGFVDITKNPRTTYKVETFADGGVTARVFFKSLSGDDEMISSTPVPENQEWTGSVDHARNGTYWINLVNEHTVPVNIKVLQDRNTKTPKPAEVKVDFNLGEQTQTETLAANKTEAINGYLRQRLGPGFYNITVRYEQTVAKAGSPFRTVADTRSMILNDRPYADTHGGDPYVLTFLDHTLRLDATRSFDDGPKEALYIYWSFGATSTGGSLGEVEGRWEDYREHIHIYGSELPDPVDGKPYLIITDAYGTYSTIAYVNVQIG